MKILNYGSLNIDMVYQVPRIVAPGETMASSGYACYAGGKGLNQSAALARAGAEVYHAGKIGEDGVWLRECLEEFGVRVDFLCTDAERTGNAVIQVDDAGENAIFLYAGANHKITRHEVHQVLDAFAAGEVVLLQNEINLVGYIIEAAVERGLKVCFNPAPMTPEVSAMPLHLVDTLILNQSEAGELAMERCANSSDDDGMLTALAEKYPGVDLILTLGSQGVLARCGEESVRVGAPQVKAVDTTAAGDTFIGFYLASRTGGMELRQALEFACKAAAISVTRQGAMNSIPRLEEVQ